MKIFNHGKAITILHYFTDKVEDYWHILYPVTAGTERHGDSFLYFYDISRKATEFTGDFSSDGIYLFPGYDGNNHLHALEISQYSLACWLAWRQNNATQWSNQAMLHCDWLINNQQRDGAWYIIHKNPLYADLPTPWPSSLAQGLAISSLLRAWRFSQQSKYLKAAEAAADFLDLDCEYNGLKRQITMSGVTGFIYEEYPRQQLNGVLNGYISVVLALEELSHEVDSYRQLFNINIDNLLRLMPLFDTGFWSYYALDGNIASGFYHRLVVKQLQVLIEFDDGFRFWHDKFLAYQNSKYCAIKALVSKLRKKL